MRNITITILMLFILAACGSQATPTPERIPAVAANIEPTSAQVVVEPTAAPVEVSEPTGAGGPVYKIIPGESVVTYEVGETFFNDNNRFNVAIGETTQITGDILVDPANPANSSLGPIEIDISLFKSDSNRRDGVIRDRFLESAKYPIATFTPTSVDGLPPTYTAGEQISFQVTGDLTIKETTKQVTFDVSAKLEGDTLTGSATTTILMSDYGVGPIEIASILGTEDQVKLTLSFVARP